MSQRQVEDYKFSKAGVALSANKNDKEKRAKYKSIVYNSVMMVAVITTLVFTILQYIK